MTVDTRYSHNRAAHRRLYSGSRGLDVAQLEHALNTRINARKEFGFHNIKANGIFEGQTREAWIDMAKAIGLDHRDCTVGNQVLMRSPWKRTPAQVKKEHHWTHDARAALELRKSAHNAGDKAVEFMLHRVGWVEHPANSNDSEFLRHWREALHMAWMRGEPWCGFACLAAYHYGAGVNLPQGIVLTSNIVQWAHQGNHFIAVPASKARRGDLGVFNFPGGSSVADHVGLCLGPAKGGRIPTVDGNTSFDNSNEANGGAIAIKNRSVGSLAVVARPKL